MRSNTYRNMSQTKITNKASAILAFYPRPKVLGFALMDSPTSVLESGYRYLSSKDVTSYVEFVSALVRYYQPALIILESEKSRRQHRGKHMLHTFKKIETMIVQLNHRITHYSRADIRSHFGRIDKHDIARKVAKQFPEYRDRVPKPRASFDGAESPKLSEFDSLSLGITHFAQNKTRRHH